MLIDIIAAILVVTAIIKGFRNGLIVALFSVIAFIVGIAAAMKLSLVVSGYLQGALPVSDRWLPVISFILVFIVVVLLIRLAARIITSAVEWTLLGWVNKLGGVLLYLLLYLIILSVMLFFAEQIHLLGEDAIAGSVTYPLVRPWGPWAIDAFGSIVPLFKDMFAELEQFFDRVTDHTAPDAGSFTDPTLPGNTKNQ